MARASPMRSVKADFTFQKQLGSGTYGVVWQATRKFDGQTYAIKELDLRLLDRQAGLCRNVMLRHAMQTTMYVSCPVCET